MFVLIIAGLPWVNPLFDYPYNLKNIIDVKEAEITTFKSVNESHKKLNGELRQEIQNLKKQADDMLLYP